MVFSRKWGLISCPQINYLKPVHEVYTEITRAAILVDQSLRILYEVSAYPRTSGLPSWVPDWSDTAHSNSIYTELVCAAKTSRPVFSFESSNRLVLSGVVLDTLENVALSSSMNTADFDTEEWMLSDRSTAGPVILIAAIQTLREWIRVGRQLQVYATGERPQDAFCLTITQNGTLGDSEEYQNPALYLECFDLWFSIMNADDPVSGSGMDHLLTMVETHEKYALLLDVWKEQLGYNKSLADDVDEVKICAAMNLYGPAGLHMVALANTYNRTFFITKGYMGIGPRSVQSGDSVAIFSGLKLPFIIRPHQESYRMIGPAYIHGIMHGERWPGDPSRLEYITIV
jgi:hypothetical protein